MKHNRHTTDQIIEKLRQAEQGKGLTIDQVCRKLEISRQTSSGRQKNLSRNNGLIHLMNNYSPATGYCRRFSHANRDGMILL